MIHVQTKRFQVALWESEDRAGPGLQMHFDTLAEAEGEFRLQQASGYYRTGILIEWRKHSESWLLIDTFRSTRPPES